VALLSGLGLSVELLLIHWLDVHVRPLAYLKNLPLIASFLGLGIGFALAGWARSLLRFALPLFFAALIFASAVRGRANLAPALASNMVGSVLGGLLENLSRVTGIAGLSVLAIFLYAASYRR
jgi:hypothetical protein